MPRLNHFIWISATFRILKMALAHSCGYGLPLWVWAESGFGLTTCLFQVLGAE